MTPAKLDEQIKFQREYYAITASEYDVMHIAEDDEHGFALAYMIAAADFLGIQSILDLGSGTGRALVKIKTKLPHIRIVGIEPSPELREIGYSKGLSQSELIDGDAMKLKFTNESFDLVCEYGALHHLPIPSVAVSEMLRVSKKAIFISDSNNFGQGTKLLRNIKQFIDAFGFWPIANYIKTKGKGYAISEGDGLSYSYSVFNDFVQIKSNCKSVHILNTTNSGPNLYKSASHVAILGIR